MNSSNNTINIIQSKNYQHLYFRKRIELTSRYVFKVGRDTENQILTLEMFVEKTFWRVQQDIYEMHCSLINITCGFDMNVIEAWLINSIKSKNCKYL